jgi:RNA 3'-terminal phosphate cyclase (ATP)
VWLIWQAIYPYIVFNLQGSNRQEQGGSTADPPHDSPNAPNFRITLRGGTNVPKSPSSEYVRQVFLPLCEKIGLPKLEVNVLNRGWAGSASAIGEVEITVHQTESGGISSGEEPGVFQLQPFTLLDRGTITKVEMTIIAGSQETYTMLETQLPTALRTLGATGALPIDLPIATHPSSTPSSGDERRLYVLLVAHTSNGYRLGRDCLGTGRKITNESERRQIVAQVVGTVARELIAECQKGGCFDEYAEDQIVVFQALAEGRGVIETGRKHEKHKGKTAGVDGGGEGSLHTRTVRWVCQEMLGTVFDNDGGCLGRALDARETDVHETTTTMASLEIGSRN